MTENFAPSKVMDGPWSWHSGTLQGALRGLGVWSSGWRRSRRQRMDQSAAPPPSSPQLPCPPQSAPRSSTQHSSPPPEARRQQCSLLGGRERVQLTICPCWGLVKNVPQSSRDCGKAGRRDCCIRRSRPVLLGAEPSPLCMLSQGVSRCRHQEQLPLP